MKPRDPASNHDDGRAFAQRIAHHYSMPALTDAERAAFDRRLAARLDARSGFDWTGWSWWPALACAGAAATLALFLIGGDSVGGRVDEATDVEVSTIEARANGSDAPAGDATGIFDQPELVLLSLADEPLDPATGEDGDEDTSLPSDYEAIAGLFL